MGARGISLGLGLVTIGVAGCVSVPVPQTVPADTIGTIVVVAAPQAPEIRFEGFVRGKAEGAAVAARDTFAGCVGVVLQGSGAGACAPCAILLLGFCGVAVPVGGVVGAVSAPSAKQVKGVMSSLTALDANAIQESLRQRIAAVAHLESGAGTEAAQTRLEVGLTRVGTEGRGINAPVSVRMHARVRLLRASDGAGMFDANYVYLGERLPLADWSANQAGRLLYALEQGYEALATQIYEDVFLLYPFPGRRIQEAGLFGLAPVSPATLGPVRDDPIIGGQFAWRAVDSLTPTLRWQSFPRPADLAEAPTPMSRVRNVRYDLVIARENNLERAEQAYRRDGLPEASHTLEVALTPATRYFWTVRARFELDGRERVTEWGSTDYAFEERSTAPSHRSFRFRTPGR